MRKSNSKKCGGTLEEWLPRAAWKGFFFLHLSVFSQQKPLALQHNFPF
jgi:hypothetical protein